MARYIDADALIQYCEENWIPLNVDAVNKIPNADVVEKKEGSWIFDDSYAYIERYICSSCRESYKVDTFMGKPMWDYCPNCGAEMQKGVKIC